MPQVRLSPLISGLKSIGQRLTTFWRFVTQKATLLITRWPLASFFGLLALVIALIVIGNQLRKPKTEEATQAPEPKQVLTYSLGTTPTLTVQAQVKNAGVLTIVAQTGGVVSKINVTEGDAVRQGQRLVSLSSNYQGGNAASLTRQLSQKNYQHIVDTLPTQQEIIQKNKDLAQKNETQAKELRAIGRAAQADTRSLIDENEAFLKDLSDQIDELKATNVNGSNTAALNQLTGSKIQIESALSGLRASLRASEYTNSDDKELAAMATISKDSTLKQLEIQEKALELNKDIALLNLRLAQVGESLMYPATPCSGVVEKIHVSVGQVVSPGTVIATVTATKSTTTVEAQVVGTIAEQVSVINPSTIHFDAKSIQLVPRYVSTQPTNGTLHSILFTLPEAEAANLNDGAYVTVSLPLGSGVASDRFIPLDAVYFSQTGAYVYVADQTVTPARAVTKKVNLGTVYGQMVEVVDGLAENEQVILDRTVVETDLVNPVLTLSK